MWHEKALMENDFCLIGSIAPRKATFVITRLKSVITSQEVLTQTGGGVVNGQFRKSVNSIACPDMTCANACQLAGLISSPCFR